MTDDAASVTELYEGAATHVPTPGIPIFEGRQVDAAHLKIAGTTPLDDVGDIVVSVDDRVRLVAEYTVVGVRHYVHPGTGDLVREQILKPLVAELAPWDPTDPTDDGVIRALSLRRTTSELWGFNSRRRASRSTSW
jgi:hypothetical protein